jgi:hypothetical protein
MNNRALKFTDTSGWPEHKIWARIGSVKERLGWDECHPRAKRWWCRFEQDNGHRSALVLRVVEELLSREASLNEFFFACVWSNTENIQGNLDFLDLVRQRVGHRKRLKPEDFEFSVC